jgi:hypothetical protein
MVVLLASMAWVARAHIMKILLAVIGRYKEPPGTEYMSYRVAAILFVVCFAIATGWLTIAGVGFFFSIVLMTVLFMILVTVARIVAETGAFFVQTNVSLTTPTTFVAFPHLTFGISQDSYLIGHMVSVQMWDVSEAHMPFAINALRVADGAKRIDRRHWLMPITLVGLAVAFVVAASSYGYLAYSHGAMNFMDQWGAGAGGPLHWVHEGAATYKTVGNQYPYTMFPWFHFTLGAAIVGILAFGRYRWARWPLVPVGYLLANVFAMWVTWFSICVGWALKVTVLKFGGALLHNRLKPVFIGMIVGDAIVGGIWVLLALFLDIPKLVIVPS